MNEQYIVQCKFFNFDPKDIFYENQIIIQRIKIHFYSFDPNPMKRVNFWGVIFGNALTGASLNGHRQEGYQRP